MDIIVIVFAHKTMEKKAKIHLFLAQHSLADHSLCLISSTLPWIHDLPLLCALAHPASDLGAGAASDGAGGELAPGAPVYSW